MDGVSVMTQETATEADLPAPRQRSDLLGIAYLGTIAVAMLAWISGLVWGAMAFFSWLVS